jgi:hypothetical protein
MLKFFKSKHVKNNVKKNTIRVHNWMICQSQKKENQRKENGKSEKKQPLMITCSPKFCGFQNAHLLNIPWITINEKVNKL